MPDLSLRQIPFHSDLVSKPVRDNFTDTENAINNLQDQIDLLTTTPGGTEVTNARDYHTVLRDRLRSDSLGRGNVLVSGGVVTEQGSPNMTVAISAGEAVVGGIACKWSAQNSGTITAPVSNTRLDYVVVNSDNTISVVAGTASASPAFPSVSSTQLIVAALVVKSTTTSLNDEVEIFNFRNTNDLGFPNHYIGSATTLRQGLFQFNNLIIDAACTIDFTTTTGILIFQRIMLFWKCKGNLIITSNGSISVTSPHAITATSDYTGAAGFVSPYDSNNFEFITGAKGSDGGAGVYTAGTAVQGGSGATGAGSIVAAGGAGGAGGTNGSIGKTTSDGAGGVAVVKIMPAIFIKCYNFKANGSITNSGNAGTIGSNAAGATEAAAGGGASGGSGGYLFLAAENDITIGSGVTITCAGGSGGAGGASTTGSSRNGGGGGGGGGAGGAIYFRSLTYTNGGTVTAAGGGGGAGGNATGGTASNGSNGSNGGAGTLDQALWTDTATALKNTFFPFNVMDF